MTSQTTRILGEYRLDASLGTGSVGETFRAVNLRSPTVAAVKVVHAGLTTSADFARRFDAQLARLSAVHDPHVLTATSYGQGRGEFYVAADFMHGGSLRGLLQRRATDLPLWF